MNTNKKISKKIMKSCFKTLLIGAIGISVSGAALAEYPKRTISFVTPFGSGGATDIAARTLVHTLSGYSEKPIVVVNRDGAGGAVGSTYVAKEKPDGYTMLATRVGSHSVAPAMKKRIPYSLDDFTYVGVFELTPMLCAVSANSDIKSMKDLVAKINSNPGEVSYTSSGVGSMQHLSSVMIQNTFGVDNPVEQTIHLPTRGGGGAPATAVLNGSGDFLCESSSVLVNFIEAGQLVPLLVTGKERLPGIDAPTGAELGYPELEILVAWTGVAGPKSLDSKVVDKWSEWLSKAAVEPSYVSKVEALGSQAVYMTPEESKSFIENQSAAFHKLVEKFGMEID